MHKPPLFLLILISFAASVAADEPIRRNQRKIEEKRFLEAVAPALEQACIRCHNDSKHRGGFSFETEIGWRKGSDSGPVIDLDQPEQSRFLEVIQGDSPEMPPKGEPLKPEVVAAISQWIRNGSPWPEGHRLADRSRQTEEKLWSFEPIKENPVPTPPDSHRDWVKNPVDAYIATAHAQRGFLPTVMADRRTLIRRLSFDLTGLPPTPGEIADFENDPAPDAYEKLVDRLLGSQSYGERWARHWLDIVHYGETHGYDKDKPRPNSWPFRDYVIDSLNQDKPYARFVQEQIAGDRLFPDDPDAIRALGFLAAGPWDFIGHAEVPETKTDGKIARNLDRDDMVGTAIGTFMSLTVQCARCHDHKFDPITQTDYYQLQAVFAGVDRADRPLFEKPEDQAKYENLKLQKGQLTRERIRIDRQIHEQAGPELEKWNARIESARRKSNQKRDAQYGYHSGIAANSQIEKWVQLNFPEPVEVAGILIAPCSDNFNNIGDGFGFPPRYRIETSDTADFTKNVRILVDQTAGDQPNPGISPLKFQFPEPVKSKYVRFTATKLATRSNDYIFAISEWRVLDSRGENQSVKATVEALDSIEAPPRWQKANLIDGLAPGLNLPHDGESPESLIEQKQQWLASRVNSELLKHADTIEKELARVEFDHKGMQPVGQVYAATVHQGSGAFTGTGASGGMPRTIFRLNRGDVSQPAEEVSPGAIASLRFADFSLKPEQSEEESARRSALALWLTHRENPLLWRSIVNRVWHYHFGRGLVETPGDFGFMGGTPSHPELLDYLALVFRDGGGSLKSLHRLIVTSATYQQASRSAHDYSEKDSENVYLWRQNRRKLEAEAIRDSILAVSGKLNPKKGGPSFQDFVITHPEHSPHYEYDQADLKNPEIFRRSVYRFVVRSQPQPFMASLDCADPSIRVDRRNQSVSAAQALAQWNDSMILVMAEAFGHWMEKQTGDANQKISSGFEKACGRVPDPQELKALIMYQQKFGFAAVARLLFNLNEFSFVD